MFDNWNGYINSQSGHFMLNSNSIPEKSEKSEFYMVVPKTSIFQNWLIFYIRVAKMRRLVKSIQTICIFEDFTAIKFFCVVIRIWPKNYNFFLKYVTKEFQKSHKTTFNSSVAICSNNKVWKCGAVLPLPGSNRVKGMSVTSFREAFGHLQKKELWKMGGVIQNEKSEEYFEILNFHK